MADFDAGSIEGRLDLDTDPFEEGLRKARAEAAAFEARSVTKTVDYETKGMPAEAKGPSDEKVKVDIEDTGFRAGLMRDRDELGRFTAKKHKVDISTDTDPLIRSLRNLDGHINNVAGFYKRNGAPGMPGTGHGLMMLVGLAAALAPALGPAAGAIALFGAAGTAAMGGAAASMMLYAKVAGGVIGQLTDAIKQGKELPGLAGKAEDAIKGLQSAWSGLQKAAAPGIFHTLIPIVHTLTGVLPKLLPLINGISTGLQGAFVPIQHLLESGLFDHFVKLLGNNAIKDLPQIGQALANGLAGLMHLFQALNPVIQAMLPVVVKLTDKFNRWAEVKAPGFVHDLFGTIQQYGPPTLHLFGLLATALVNLGKGFAPLVGPALTFLTGLAGALGKLDLGPLASGVGDVLKQLTPFLDVIATLVNILLPPLGVLLGTIADSFIGPLGKSLTSELAPGFAVLSRVLGALAKPLGLIISSFADLVNPTGVGLLVKLLEGLESPVTRLLDPLGRLIVALESVVDDGLELIAPAIGPAGKALDVLAQALAPVIDFLATLLGNKAVVDTILLLAAATKAWSIAMTLLDIAMDANPIGLVAIAAAALVLGIIALWQHSETFRTIILALWGALKATGSWLAGAGLAVWHALGAAFEFVKHHLSLLFLLLGPFGAAILGVIQIVKHWSTVTHVLHEAWDAVLHFLSGIPGKIKGWFSSAGQWLVSAGRGIFHGLQQGLQTIWNTEVQGWRTVGSKVKGWFNGAVSWLVSIGRSIFHGLQSGLSAVWNSEVQGWQNIGSRIKGWFAGAGGWLTSIGASIVQGLWNGLTSVWSSMESWLSSKIAGLSGIAKHLLGINSPSRVFIPIGGGIAEGFHVGLKAKWNSLVVPFMDTAVRGLSDAAQLALNGVGDLSLAGAVNVSATGLNGRLGTLSSAVADLTAQQARNSADLAAALATPLSDLAAAQRETQDGLTDSLSTAFERATDKQTTRLITAGRTNR